MSPAKYFPPKRNFRSLSVKDLLDAREAYHMHLQHLENVIATAIGRYRIRIEDPDAQKAGDWRKRIQSPIRTLSNTVVQPWSWPCILVFVSEWVKTEKFDLADADQVVPRYLYLPDGRVVPTCVILAEKEPLAPPPLQDLAFPADLVGGGYPLITETQQQQHVGSLACLVSNGDSVYALTNRHVTGERRREELEGRPIYTIIGGQRKRIGETDVNQIGKKPFEQVYPGWPGSRVYSNLDAGLIRIDDVNAWTAQVFGVGEIAEPVDLNMDTISLDLIGCPVRAFGGASGELIGEIQALFYRYKSIGGFDYVSDLLIGPRHTGNPVHNKDQDPEEVVPPVQIQPLRTQPGDSGTLWFFDSQMSPEEARKEGKAGARARRLRPLALQWGGQTLMENNTESKTQFALATCLSTVCRELDVDILPDWNTGHSEYWGKLGHYKIAAKACALVVGTKLKKLMMGNLSLIAFDDEAIKAGELKRIDNNKFVPLADVPDLVWRATRKKDEANHFADMDEEGQDDFKNTTLLKLCEDTSNLSLDVWNRFYDSIKVGFKRGALPFRVWQLYTQMVKSVKAGQVAEFLCAAGVMAHYVGDACQPLHVSHLHHGRPGHPEEEDVHAVYETRMLDRFAADIIGAVNQELTNRVAKANVKGGKEAALSVVSLMRNTVKQLPPLRIIEVYNEVPGGPGRTENMFNKLGKKTASVMAEGCVCLASLWASAWKEGNGNKIATTKLGLADWKELQKLYNTKSFVEAFRLKEAGFADVL
jgi:hypothetical protein